MIDLHFLHAFLNKTENETESKKFEENNPDSKEEQTEVKKRAEKNCCFSFFYQVVISVTFNFLIYCLILANTITLAMYRFNQSKEQTETLEYLDIFFVWVFTVEMVMKLLGLGLRNYLRDKFNIFDCSIVLISLVDFAVVVSGVIDLSGSEGILSAFRALRLLRVVKLARQWKGF